MKLYRDELRLYGNAVFIADSIDTTVELAQVIMMHLTADITTNYFQTIFSTQLEYVRYVRTHTLTHVRTGITAHKQLKRHTHKCNHTHTHTYTLTHQIANRIIIKPCPIIPTEKCRRFPAKCGIMP